MKNNLFNKEAAEQIVTRVQQLQASAKALWGTMTATEMLLHCNKVHEQLLSASTPSGKKTSLKQYLLRWIVLYIMPHFPKNAKAPKQMRTKGIINNAAFEEQKNIFGELIRRFSAHTTPITHRHPYFGNLTSKQWGIAAWKHVDHHLRQFGI